MSCLRHCASKWPSLMFTLNLHFTFITWAVQQWKYYLPSNITLLQVLPLAEWIIVFSSFNCQGSELGLAKVTPGRFASDVPWRAGESLGVGEATEPPSGLALQKRVKPFDLRCCENVWFDLRRVSLQAALWKREKKKKSLELCKCYCFFEKLFANRQETLPFFGFATFAFHQISKQPAEGSGQYLEVVECRSWKDGQSCFISNLLKICPFSSVNTVGWCTVAVPPEAYCSAWVWFHLQMLEWRNVIFEPRWMVRCT